MTTRYGCFPRTLRLLRRLPPSTLSSRSFSASRPLKEPDPEENVSSPKETDNKIWRKLSSREGTFPAKVRFLMRSTPNALTAITSCPYPTLYRDEQQPSAAASENKPIEAFEVHDMDQLPFMSGLLVSSFNTVTLDPTPYVSFNIRVPSLTYTVMKVSNGFFASGLKDSRVADAFAKNKFPPGDPSAENFWRHLVKKDGRLRKGRGGTWWMRCSLVPKKCVEVGDHIIVVGKVLQCGGYEDEGGTGLVYAEGEYRKVGEQVDMDKERQEEFEKRAGFRTPTGRTMGVASLVKLSGFRRPSLLYQND